MEMTQTCSRWLAASATTWWFFIVLVGYTSRSQSLEQVGLTDVCNKSISTFCGDADRQIRLAPTTVSHCGGSKQDQLTLQLHASSTWAFASWSGGKGEQLLDAGAPAPELAGQLSRLGLSLNLSATVLFDRLSAVSVSSGASSLLGETLKGPFTGWIAWPESFPATDALAQGLPSPLLLQDPDLVWSDVLPKVRSLVSLYGGRIQAVPYAVEVPLLLYRRDVLERLGTGPAATWQDLITQLQQLAAQEVPAKSAASNTGVSSPAGEDAAPVAGFCNALPPGCNRDADLLISIWASASLSAMPVLATCYDLELLMDAQLRQSGATSSLEAALQLYRSLMGLAPADAGHARCSRPPMEQALNRCAVVVGPSSAVKAALWRLGGGMQQGQQPEQGLGQDGRRLHGWLGGRGAHARVLTGAAAGGGVALTAPLPGSYEGACANGTGEDCTLGSSPQRHVNRAVYLGRDVLGYQVNARAPPELQYAAWRLASRALGQASSWEAVLKPLEGGATVFRMSQLSDVGRWAAAGYDPDDITAYLAALKDSLTGPLTFAAPRLPASMLDQLYGILAHAANEAAFGSMNARVLAETTVSNLTALYNANRSPLLVALVRHLGLTPGAVSDPAAASGTGSATSLNHDATIGVIISCVVGGVTLIALGAVSWKVARKDSESEKSLSRDVSSAPELGPDTTLMLTDVQDSTTLWESLPADVMDKALNLHNEAFRHLLPRYRGYECHTEGDSFVLAFHTAVEAAAFALEIQLVLLQVNWPQELLDHELCAVVRQVPPTSDSNEGDGSGGAQVLNSNEGGAPTGSRSDGAEEQLPASGGGSAMPLRTGSELAELAAAGASVIMEPWGLQAVDEEQAATGDSEERLINTLFKKTHRRPVGRSRTFSTPGSLRPRERNTWAAGLRRPARMPHEAMTGPLGEPNESWMAHRSLSESRPTPAGGALRRDSDTGIIIGVERASGGSYHAGVGMDAALQHSRTLLQRHHRPHALHLSPPAQSGQPAQASQQPWPTQTQQPQSPLALSPRQDPGIRKHAGRALAHGLLHPPEPAHTGTPHLRYQAALSLQKLQTRFPARHSMLPSDSGFSAGPPRMDLSLPLQLTELSLSNADFGAGVVASLDSVMEVQEEGAEASLRLPVPSGGTRVQSQELASRPLWGRSLETSGNLNSSAVLNSKSLCLMHGRASARSSTGTTPPFTGLLATLRVSGDGEADVGAGGGGSGGGGTTGAVIGGVDFILRAALASSAGRRRGSVGGECSVAAVLEMGRFSRDPRLGVQRFKRQSSTSSEVSIGAMSRRRSAATVGSADTPLILVGSPTDLRRRQRRSDLSLIAAAYHSLDRVSSCSSNGGGAVLQELRRSSDPRAGARSALSRAAAAAAAASEVARVVGVTGSLLAPRIPRKVAVVEGAQLTNAADDVSAEESYSGPANVDLGPSESPLQPVGAQGGRAAFRTSASVSPADDNNAAPHALPPSSSSIRLRAGGAGGAGTGSKGPDEAQQSASASGAGEATGEGPAAAVSLEGRPREGPPMTRRLETLESSPAPLTLPPQLHLLPLSPSPGSECLPHGAPWASAGQKPSVVGTDTGSVGCVASACSLGELSGTGTGNITGGPLPPFGALADVLPTLPCPQLLDSTQQQEQEQRSVGSDRAGRQLEEHPSQSQHDVLSVASGGTRSDSVGRGFGSSCVGDLTLMGQVGIEVRAAAGPGSGLAGRGSSSRGGAAGAIGTMRAVATESTVPAPLLQVPVCHLADRQAGNLLTRYDGALGAVPTTARIAQWLTGSNHNIMAPPSAVQPQQQQHQELDEDLNTRVLSQEGSGTNPQPDRMPAAPNGAPASVDAVDPISAPKGRPPGDDVTFPAIPGSNTTASAGTAFPPMRAHGIHSLVRRTLSDLRVYNIHAGIPEGDEGPAANVSGMATSPALRSMRRGVGRSASAGAITAAAAAGNHAPITLGDTPTYPQRIESMVPSANQGPQPTGAMMLRRQRTATEYVQSPLSRKQLTVHLAETEMPEGKPVEPAELRMAGGDSSTTGMMAPVRRGTREHYDLIAAQPLQHPHHSAFSGQQPLQPSGQLQATVEGPWPWSGLPPRPVMPPRRQLSADGDLAPTGTPDLARKVLRASASGVRAHGAFNLPRLRLQHSTIAESETSEAGGPGSRPRSSPRAANAFSDPGGPVPRPTRPLPVLGTIASAPRVPVGEVLNRTLSPDLDRISSAPRVNSGLASAQPRYSSLGVMLPDPAGTPMTTWRRLPHRTPTPPPRASIHSHSTGLKGHFGALGSMHGGPLTSSCGVYGQSSNGTSFGHGAGAHTGAVGSLGGGGGGGGQVYDNPRLWAGLEALMLAYGNRGVAARSVYATRARGSASVSSAPSMPSVTPGAGDSVAGVAAALCDSRTAVLLQDAGGGGGGAGSSQMMYDSAALPGMLEIAQGSIGTLAAPQYHSSVLPMFTSRDAAGGGRDSNTGRLISVLSTALKTKRISRGGASLGSMLGGGGGGGGGLLDLGSKRVSTLSTARDSTSTARGGGEGGGSESPSTFMEAMLQLATGTILSHSFATHANLVNGASGGSSIPGLRRTHSPLTLLGVATSNGGNRSARMLARLAVLSGRESDTSGAAATHSGAPSSPGGAATPAHATLQQSQRGVAGISGMQASFTTHSNPAASPIPHVGSTSCDSGPAGCGTSTAGTTAILFAGASGSGGGPSVSAVQAYETCPPSSSCTPPVRQLSAVTRLPSDLRLLSFPECTPSERRLDIVMAHQAPASASVHRTGRGQAPFGAAMGPVAGGGDIRTMPSFGRASLGDAISVKTPASGKVLPTLPHGTLWHSLHGSGSGGGSGSDASRGTGGAPLQRAGSTPNRVTPSLTPPAIQTHTSCPPGGSIAPAAMRAPRREGEDTAGAAFGGVNDVPGQPVPPHMRMAPELRVHQESSDGTSPVLGTRRSSMQKELLTPCLPGTPGAASLHPAVPVPQTAPAAEGPSSAMHRLQPSMPLALSLATQSQATVATASEDMDAASKASASVPTMLSLMLTLPSPPRASSPRVANPSGVHMNSVAPLPLPIDSEKFGAPRSPRPPKERISWHGRSRRSAAVLPARISADYGNGEGREGTTGHAATTLGPQSPPPQPHALSSPPQHAESGGREGVVSRAVRLSLMALRRNLGAAAAPSPFAVAVPSAVTAPCASPIMAAVTACGGPSVNIIATDAGAGAESARLATAARGSTGDVMMAAAAAATARPARLASGTATGVVSNATALESGGEEGGMHWSPATSLTSPHISYTRLYPRPPPPPSPSVSAEEGRAVGFMLSATGSGGGGGGGTVVTSVSALSGGTASMARGSKDSRPHTAGTGADLSRTLGAGLSGAPTASDTLQEGDGGVTTTRELQVLLGFSPAPSITAPTSLTRNQVSRETSEDPVGLLAAAAALGTTTSTLSEIQPARDSTGAGGGGGGGASASAGGPAPPSGAIPLATTSRTGWQAPAPSLSLVHVLSASASGGGGFKGGAGGGGSDRNVRRRRLSRNPTPERLMAGLARRLDSIVGPGSDRSALDMPAWDAAAREGMKSRQAGGPASLVGRLGAGVVHRIAPGSRKALAPAGVNLDAICFRGFHVRIGMHSGLEDGNDVRWTKHGGRRAYSGPAKALARTVSDLIPGGMVILTSATFERLQPWPNAEALPGAIIWARGRFCVSVGEAGTTDGTEVDVYQLLCAQLLPRQPFLERRPWRGAEQVLPGVLSAPLGRLALVMVQVAGVQVLTAWNSEITGAALRVFGAVVAEMLPAWGGFPASLSVETGSLLAAFREPALALGFMHALIDVLRDAEWPAELLAHELGEPLAMPLSHHHHHHPHPGTPPAGGGGPLEAATVQLPLIGMNMPGTCPAPAQGSAAGGGGGASAHVGVAPPSPGPPSATAGEMGGNLFRGLRLRCVADVASVRVDLGCATAAALYEARDPKAFKSLRRMMGMAHMGAVLCSGLLVSEVMSGPPAALAALHELLAFAPLPSSAAAALAHLASPAVTCAPSRQPSQRNAPLPSPLSATGGCGGGAGAGLQQASSFTEIGATLGSASVSGLGGLSGVGGGGGGGVAGSFLTNNGLLVGGTVPVNARLTGKEASRLTVYQCTRRRPVRRSGMGQAGFALVGSVSGVYGNAATGMYGTGLYSTAGASVGGVAGGSMPGLPLGALYSAAGGSVYGGGAVSSVLGPLPGGGGMCGTAASSLHSGGRTSVPGGPGGEMGWGLGASSVLLEEPLTS